MKLLEEMSREELIEESSQTQNVWKKLKRLAWIQNIEEPSLKNRQSN